VCICVCLSKCDVYVYVCMCARAFVCVCVCVCDQRHGDKNGAARPKLLPASYFEGAAVVMAS